MSLLEPDKEAAYAFLAHFGGPYHTFQVFHDRHKERLAAVFTDTLDGAYRFLRKKNRAGYGVHFSVNETDGTGRRAENIVSARALFFDADDGVLRDGLGVNLLVATHRGYHGYWLLRPGESLDRYIPAQEAIAHALGTDTHVRHVNRNMRLPGFFHRKVLNAPYMVTFRACSDRRYTIDEVINQVNQWRH